MCWAEHSVHTPPFMHVPFLPDTETGTGECANAAVGPWTARALRPQPDDRARQPASSGTRWLATSGVRQAPSYVSRSQVTRLLFSQQMITSQLFSNQTPTSQTPTSQTPTSQLQQKWILFRLRLKDSTESETSSFLPRSLMLDEAGRDLRLLYLTIMLGSADIFVWADESWLPEEQTTKIFSPTRFWVHLWDSFYVLMILTILSHLT